MMFGVTIAMAVAPHRTRQSLNGNRWRGASGEPECAQGESDWRKRLAEARAIGEARELERRGRTMAPGGGAEEARGL